MLSIPNVVMQPALDEVQQTVNKASQAILNVFKGVSQWSKDPRFMVQKVTTCCVLLLIKNDCVER